MSKVGLVFDPFMMNHRAEGNHVENPERLLVIYSEILDLIPKVKIVKSRNISSDELLVGDSYDVYSQLLNSPQSYGDNYFNDDTVECSLLAAGSTMALTEKIMRRELDRGFAIVRPPGHHAYEDMYAGFCFLNNVAISALNMAKMGEKVLIVDWDIHFGDGTHSIVKGKKDIFYYSIHRYNNGDFYPGKPEMIPGKDKNTFNVGLNGEVNSDRFYNEFRGAFDEIVENEFKPTVILVSCGFDACEGDPLGECDVAPKTFGRMTKHVMDSVEGARVCLVLEGGYNLEKIGTCARYCLKELVNYKN